MKKTIFIKTLLATALLSTAHTVLADESIFKVAVIQGSVGTEEIAKGEVATGIQKLNAAKRGQDLYAKNMNLCAAYLQLEPSVQSELACTEAIKSLKSKSGMNSKVKYLTSLNYSNRGVARYKKNQMTEALQDFKQAVLIDNNPITVSNLKRMQLLMPVESVDSSELLSD